MKPDKIKTYLDDMRCWYESHDRLNSRGANMNRDALAYIKKLEAVVEAAREVVRDPYLDEIEHLAGTLKTLDETGSDKNDESSLNQSKD